MAPTKEQCTRETLARDASLEGDGLSNEIGNREGRGFFKKVPNIYKRGIIFGIVGSVYLIISDHDHSKRKSFIDSIS